MFTALGQDLKGCRVVAGCNEHIASAFPEDSCQWCQVLSLGWIVCVNPDFRRLHREFRGLCSISWWVDYLKLWPQVAA